MWYRSVSREVATFANVFYSNDKRDNEATHLSRKGKTMIKPTKRKSRQWVVSAIVIAILWLLLVAMASLSRLESDVELMRRNGSISSGGSIISVPGGGGGGMGTIDGAIQRGGSRSVLSTTSTTTAIHPGGINHQQQRRFQRELLPPSIWTTRKLSQSNSNRVNISSLLSSVEIEKAMTLCGNFLYSSLRKGAVEVENMGYETFVSTGDIDDMWTRDSIVQMSIYLNRPPIIATTKATTTASSSSSSSFNSSGSTTMPSSQFLQLVIEGAIRRNAFNIIQDPYANAYSRYWKDPTTLNVKDQVIGRGGFVATRNYELDSGAYFLHHLYDYLTTDKNLYKPELLLQEPLIFNAVNTLIDIWIVEQHHEEQSPYRYFELDRDGKGKPTTYTGMTWSGFRPSDDACNYGYLIPANIHAAAALERTLILNERIWQHGGLEEKVTKLLHEIEHGINTFGIVSVANGMSKNTTSGMEERIYAYEVDGRGGQLTDFDDANVPSLLSIPLLGWTGYNPEVYQATRKRLLSPDTNKYYYAGAKLQGIGSPHTPRGNIWPMALVIQALTEGSSGTSSSEEEVSRQLVFQFRQLLKSACQDRMHESVHSNSGCPRYTRNWFEWANALYVVFVETLLNERCDAVGRSAYSQSLIPKQQNNVIQFYENKYKNSPQNPFFFQGIEASVKYVTTRKEQPIPGKHF